MSVPRLLAAALVLAALLPARESRPTALDLLLPFDVAAYDYGSRRNAWFPFGSQVLDGAGNPKRLPDYEVQLAAGAPIRASASGRVTYCEEVGPTDWEVIFRIDDRHAVSYDHIAPTAALAARLAGKCGSPQALTQFPVDVVRGELLGTTGSWGPRFEWGVRESGTPYQYCPAGLLDGPGRAALHSIVDELRRRGFDVAVCACRALQGDTCIPY
jgi:hypothetical protein